MAVLVVAEHDNAALRPATLNALAAAAKLPGPIAVLVAGDGCRAAADAAAKCAGVARVILAESPALAHGLAENMAPLVVALAKDFSHVVAPATSTAIGPGSLAAAASALSVAGRSAALSCSAITSTVILLFSLLFR